MGDINHDTVFIHLCHHLFAKWGQTVVFCSFFLVGGGVTNIVVGGVTQGDVPDPHLVKFFDHGEIVGKCIPVFHANEDGSFALFLQPVGIVWRQCDLGLARIFCHTLADGCINLKRFLLYGSIPLRSPGSLCHKNGKKLCIQSSLLHSGKITLGARSCHIIPLANIKAIPQKIERRIGVGVYRQDRLVNPCCLCLWSLFPFGYSLDKHKAENHRGTPQNSFFHIVIFVEVI